VYRNIIDFAHLSAVVTFQTTLRCDTATQHPSRVTAVYPYVSFMSLSVIFAGK